jgi:glycosyltransferase involved in cell wall biosynthesis
MALGKCVLVSDIPENLETIGDAGFSFRHGDSEDLKEKLQFLLANPDTVDRIQWKAIDRVREHYDWNKITDQLEKIYVSLMFERFGRKNLCVGPRVSSSLGRCRHLKDLPLATRYASR